MQTDNQLFQKKCRNRQKTYSEKNEFEISKLLIRHLIQNRVLHIFYYKL